MGQLHVHSQCFENSEEGEISPIQDFGFYGEDNVS